MCAPFRQSRGSRQPDSSRRRSGGDASGDTSPNPQRHRARAERPTATGRRFASRTGSTSTGPARTPCLPVTPSPRGDHRDGPTRKTISTPKRLPGGIPNSVLEGNRQSSVHPIVTLTTHDPSVQHAFGHPRAQRACSTFGSLAHFPMQKPAKIRSSRSSVAKAPTIAPSASWASRSSSATSSPALSTSNRRFARSRARKGPVPARPRDDAVP